MALCFIVVGMIFKVEAWSVYNVSWKIDFAIAVWPTSNHCERRQNFYAKEKKNRTQCRPIYAYLVAGKAGKLVLTIVDRSWQLGNEQQATLDSLEFISQQGHTAIVASIVQKKWALLHSSENQLHTLIMGYKRQGPKYQYWKSLILGQIPVLASLRHLLFFKHTNYPLDKWQKLKSNCKQFF